jgi:acyl-coenzyme A synthetase/AMP-(fatty) acid ligase
VHLHGDWSVCCEHYACGVLGLGPDDVTFSTSKLFHAYGLGNNLMFPLHVGATSVLFPGKPQPQIVLETVRDQRPTVLFSVPTLYAAMLQQAERISYDLGSVRLAVSAAEPLPAAVYIRWQERFGVEILDGIGSTEVLTSTCPSPGSRQTRQFRPGGSGLPGANRGRRRQRRSTRVIGDLLVAGRAPRSVTGGGVQ